MMQPLATPVLFAWQVLLRVRVTDPVDDNHLQAMNVVTPGVVGGSVKLEICENE